MRNRKLIKVLLVIVLAIAHPVLGTAIAQEKKEPPPRTVVIGEKEDTRSSDEAKLPKIDLPEYEITGRERVELPLTSKLDQGGLQEASIDASRLTVLGEKKNDPLTSLKEKSGTSSLQDHLSYDGKLNLGYGRFNSAYAEGWFGKKYGEGDFNLHGKYLAHKAYVDHADAATGSADASGGLSLPQRLPLFGGSKIFGQVGYEEDHYCFFGSPYPNLKRTVSNYEVGLGMRSGSNTAVSHEASVGFRRLTLSDKDKSREDNLSFAIRAWGEVVGFQLRGDLYYGADFLKQSTSTNDPHYLRATASFRKLFYEKFDLSGTVGFYLYRNSDTDFKSRFYPNVALQYYLNQQWTLFARFEPRVEQNSLSRAVSENRYIANDVKINHQDIFVNLSAGAQFQVSEKGTGRFYARYQRVRDFPLYVDPSTLFYAAIIPLPYADWNVRYTGTTRFLSLNGEVLIDLTKSDRLGGNVTLLSSHNSETKEQVPYVAPFQLSSTYSHQFLFGLSTEIRGRFVGRWPIDLKNSWKLNSYFLLDASAEYKLTKNFNLYLHLNNIFDEHYSLWNRYQEIPFSLLGGISVRW